MSTTTATRAGITIAEDEDVVASVRTVRELLQQDFGIHERHRGTTASSTPTSTNHWKTKFYQLKQAKYDEKLQTEGKLDQQRQEIRRLQNQLDLYRQEAETEREMRTTLETTLDAHNKHIQTLTKQLDKVQAERAQLEERLEGLRHVVEEGKDSLSKERSTWEELLEHTRKENERISKAIGEEEAGRLRAEARAKELQKTVKLNQIRMREAQNNTEKMQKQHALEMFMAKKVMQQKIDHLQEQLRKSQATSSVGGGPSNSSSDSDATVKSLLLKLNELESQNTSLKDDVEKMTKEATQQNDNYKKLQQQHDNSETEKSMLSEELKRIKAELEQAKQQHATASTAATSASAAVPFSTDQVKRANLMQRFENAIAQDVNLINSLRSQIAVMEKAQPSKKVKEALAEKKKVLKEKREAHIETLGKIEKLQDQQLKAFHGQLQEATTKLTAARQQWHACEEQLTAASNTAANQKDLQTKADTAASGFSAARQQWEAIKLELSNLLSKRSENRNLLADLRDHPEDSESTPSIAAANTPASKSTTKASEETPTPSKKRVVNQGEKQQAKRQKPDGSK